MNRRMVVVRVSSRILASTDEGIGGVVMGWVSETDGSTGSMAFVCVFIMLVFSVHRKEGVGQPLSYRKSTE